MDEFLKTIRFLTWNAHAQADTAVRAVEKRNYDCIHIDLDVMEKELTKALAIVKTAKGAMP